MTTAIVESRAFVAGEWIETGRWLDVHPPYSGEPVGRVTPAGRREATRAIDAASAALADALPAHERARLLDRSAGLIGERREHAARLIETRG